MYYRTFIGGDTVPGQAWKRRRSHYGEVGEEVFQSERTELRESSTLLVSIRFHVPLECEEESRAEEAGEGSRETTPDPVCLLEQFGWWQFAGRKWQVTVVFITTRTGWMDDKHGAWGQSGRYCSWRQWKVQYLINTINVNFQKRKNRQPRRLVIK